MIEIRTWRDLLLRVLARVERGAGKVYRRALIVEWIRRRLGEG